MRKTRRRSRGKKPIEPMPALRRGRTLFGGIDLGGLSGRLVFRRKGESTPITTTVAVNTPSDPERFVSGLKEPGEALLSKLGASWKDVASIGLGIPGPFDPKTGVVKTCPNLGARWRKFPLANEIKQVLDIPAFLGNDADTAGLGEFMEGSGQGRESIGGFTLGTGIGSFLIIRGPHGRPQIWRGAHGIGAEAGHIPLYPMMPMHIIGVNFEYPAPRRCNCCRTGCLESWVGAAGVERIVNDLRKLGEPSDLFAEGAWDKTPLQDHVRLIHELAEDGDSLCIRLVKMQAFCISLGIRVAAVMWDPEIFVLLGGMTKSGPRFLEQIVHYWHADNCPFPTADFEWKMPICYGELKSHAGVVGATHLSTVYDM